MNTVAFIVAVASISVAFMTLGMSIIFSIFHKDVWNRWYIVFQSCLALTIFLAFAEQVAVNFMTQIGALVFSYIFMIMQHLIMGFVTVLLPYFLRWIIGKTWKGVQRAIFFSMGIVYFSAGLVGVITDADRITSLIQAPVFVSVLAYSLIALGRNLHMVSDISSRKICKTIIIVTVCLIPTEVVIEFFPKFKSIGFAVYVLAISIVMIVYYTTRFTLDKSRIAGQIDFSTGSLAAYKISAREAEVIRSICDGKTNKEIASDMHISVNTVNNHVANIFQKMNINSRVDIVRVVKSNPWA